jgi:nucleoside-diphosphate-sugar epimerase
MTVLVTGGAGYIGSHTVHALVDAGERVVVLDNLATGFDRAIAQGASLAQGTRIRSPREFIAAHGRPCPVVRGTTHWSTDTPAAASVGRKPQGVCLEGNLPK